jgi:zinc transporter 1/2/3
MTYHEIKIPAIISFWILQLVFAFLPICIKKFRKIKLLMSLSNCFTAGLFIATGIVHILPEANENFVKGVEELEHGDHDDHSGHDHRRILEGEGGHSHGISYAHLTVLLAFSLILFIEKVVLNTNKKKKTKKNDQKKNLKKQDFIPIISGKNINNEDNMINEADKISKSTEQIAHPKYIETDTKNLMSKQDSNEIEFINKNNLNNQNKEESENETVKNDEKPKEIISKKSEKDEDHDHSHDHITFSNNSSIWSIIVVLFALGIHGFMANLSVGIEDNKDSLITLIIAIALHKWSEGLAIGIILVKKKFSRCKNIFIIVFISIFTPIGGITGLLLESANDIVKGALLSISAAAFIYIGIVEIVFEEFRYSEWKYLKFLLYSLGVGLVMLLFLVH